MEMTCQGCQGTEPTYEVSDQGGRRMHLCQSCLRFTHYAPGGSALRHPITKTITLKILTRLPRRKTIWERLRKDDVV